MIELPELFLKRMKQLLEVEFDPFLQIYSKPRVHGLRVNTLKVTVEDFLHFNPFHLTPVPWTNEGFYYEETDQPGKHVYHAAGLYYIQEPSAMAVASVLSPIPGERVLDLCAAPGGKATQIATYLQGRGLLVANEPHPVRVKALAENLERFGVKNALITNEMPNQLAKRFPSFFDRVLVDAPCSGEGMFRKDPEACAMWSMETIEQCAIRQAEILDAAAKMLRVGGKLVYSTCTFAPEENEQTIADFLERHPDFRLLTIPDLNGFSPGHEEWAQNNKFKLSQTIRLWPHKIRGEGHFIALLEKIDGEDRKIKSVTPRVPSDVIQAYLSFTQENLKEPITGTYMLFGDHLYLTMDQLPDLSGIKVIRPGLHLGTRKKNRFEPSHSLALALEAKHALRTIDFSPDSAEVFAYLRGETIPRQGEDGWTLVTVDGFPLGFGKQTGSLLKNHYPKGLRIH
ncbi:methylase [Collibacillus ludicampi]|uniref:Methylase n=1 Tax=Collibacillus ludicampi TaxID=2771369 RepID=A0AAV4LI54_9BACL|nr:methylase [Collibacillus ludicampi]